MNRSEISVRWLHFATCVKGVPKNTALKGNLEPCEKAETKATLGFRSQRFLVELEIR